MPKNSNVSFNEPEKESSDWDEEARGGNALDLVRQGTMSSDKELLRQLRDAMNPKQQEQTRLMLIQSGVGLTGLGILMGIVIVAEISLSSVEKSVVGMEGTLKEMNGVLGDMNNALTAMNTALLPVQEMETMSTTLEEMNDELNRLTQTICTSPVFSMTAAQAGCPGPAAAVGGRRRGLASGDIGGGSSVQALASDPGTEWL